MTACHGDDQELMQHRSNRTRIAREELDFRELFSMIWRRRAWLAALAVLGLVLGMAYLHTTIYRYTATLSVTASQNEASGSSSRVAGLAAITGINLTSAQPLSPFSLYLKDLQSRRAAEVLSQHDDIMKTVFADQWDSQRAMWREPAGLRRTIAVSIKDFLGFPPKPWRRPGAAELHGFLLSQISVDQEATEPYATLTFKHADAKFAARLLMRLHEAADWDVRQQTLLRTSAYIRYLSNKLTTVTVAEHRLALVATLSDQERLRMAAASNVPYAAEPFGPAYGSIYVTTPQPMLVIFIFVATSLVLGLVIIIAKDYR